MQGCKLQLDLCVPLTVDPELREDRTVRRALEERAEDKLERAAGRLIVRHFVEVSEEPHADQ